MMRLMLSIVLLLSLMNHQVLAGGKKLKIYILAGQSNMQGTAQVKTIPYMKTDARTKVLHDKIVDADGHPRVYENLCIVGFSGKSADKVVSKKGPLTIGYGGTLDEGVFGPELGFGITMGEHVKEPILIIKTAWGENSLHTDFCSPSAGPYKLPESVLASWEANPEGTNGIPAQSEREEWWKSKNEATGAFYRLMMKCVREVLDDPGQVCPAYEDEAGYEIAGFVWFQGWNDMCDRIQYPRGPEDRYRAYSDLLCHFSENFISGTEGMGETE